MACVAAGVWVGLCWGDTTVAAALPAAYMACVVFEVVAEVVPAAAEAEACPPNRREALRWLPGKRR